MLLDDLNYFYMNTSHEKTRANTIRLFFWFAASFSQTLTRMMKAVLLLGVAAASALTTEDASSVCAK